MAIITFSSNLDPNNTFLNMPSEIDPVATAGGTVFEIGDPRFTILRLEGSGFTYSAPGVPSGGALTGFTLLQGGAIAVKATGLSPLLTLPQAEALRLSGEPGTLLKYLLAGNDTAVAESGDQVIITEAGNDTLDGGAGADYLIAGDGDDLVISGLGQGPRGGAAERLVGGGGTDRLIIDRSDLALGFVFDIRVEDVTTMLDGTRLSGFEQMEFRSGSGNDVLGGGELADLINAGAGSDSMSGRGGNDTLLGGSGADEIDGGSGNDLITGDEGVDALDGGDGNDTLDGGVQADNLAGGNGDDVLSGGSDADGIDGGSGSDSLYGGLGADNVNGGSENDLVTGDQGVDVLDGGTGNDTVDGGTESDDLFGGDGDDLLIGGFGSDQMEGGRGNDLMDGGVGSDVLSGEQGNDIYWIDNAGDVLSEAVREGSDTAFTMVSYSLTPRAAIELLCTVNSKSRVPLKLTGNELANTIKGNAGANTINGLGGVDKLQGGRGRDVFVFDTTLSKRNVDNILDFRVKDDSFRLGREIFKKITGDGRFLEKDAFCLGPQAVDEDDRIIYNAPTGRIYYDEDGNGEIKPVLFAKVRKNLALTEMDFLI
jgi:Ca2+-binding RTX toxin-like protein